MLKQDIITILHVSQLITILLAIASLWVVGWLGLIAGILSVGILQLACIEVTLADRLKEWRE